MRYVAPTAILLYAFALFAAPELEVVSVAPKGELSGRNQSQSIQVVFSQPMVPLRALPKGQGSGPLHIEPPVKGTYRWKGTDVLQFTPAEPFVLNTRYRVTIPARTKSSVTDARLRTDYSWTFSTVRPRVTRVSPRPKRRRHQRYYVAIGLQQPVYVFFNQPIDTQRCARFVKVRPRAGLEFAYADTADKDPEVKGYARRLVRRGELRSATLKEVLKITPKDRWEIATDYHFTIEEGFPGLRGSLGLRREYEFVQGTHREFKLVAFEQDSQDIRAGYKPRPEMPMTLWFSNHVNWAEQFEKIHLSAGVEYPDHFARFSGKSVNVNHDLEASTDYVLTIDSSVTDIYGNLLGQTLTIEFTTGRYLPFTSIPTGHGIVEARGSRRFPLEGINADSARVSFKRLKPDELVSLLNRNDLFRGKQRIDLAPWTHVASPAGLFELNKRILIPLYLDSALEGTTGLLFAQLDNSPYYRRHYRSYPKYQKALLQVTNLGLTTKFGYENTLVAVTTLNSAEPVSNVRVVLTDTANTVHASVRTDEQGLAMLPSWREAGIPRGKHWGGPTQLVFAQKDGDVAFASSQWRNRGISPYRFGVSAEWGAYPSRIYAGQVFTERGLYRPGDTVHVKGLVRRLDSGVWVEPEYRRVEVRIRGDRAGKPELLDTVDLSSLGSFHLSHPVSPNARLQNYRIMVKVLVPGTASDLFRKAYVPHEAIRTRYRVAEYRPAEFEVHVRTDRDDYVFGDTITGIVSAHYLFGAPVKNTPARWSLRRRSYVFDPQGYDGYSFSEGVSDWWDLPGQQYRRVVASGTDTLDGDGRLKKSFALTGEGIRGSFTYTLEGTVEGNNRQSISGRASATVHAGELYIGLKPSTRMANEKKPVTINVLTLTSREKPIRAKDIELRIVRRMWYSVRKAGVGGRYEWHTEKKDSTVFARRVATSSRGRAEARFVPRQAGYYIVLATTTGPRGNTVRTATTFYVSGSGYVAWARDDDDIVELVTDKQEYEPGDRARILVKSPYRSCTALLTVEREGILLAKWIELDGTADEVVVPIKEEYLPNVFVSVVLLKGRLEEQTFGSRGEDLSKPSYKMGYTRLLVNPQSKHLSVDVSADRHEYEPGDTVRLDLGVTRPSGAGAAGEATVMVVDEGVLMLSGYRTPDPFRHFYRPRDLAVFTVESRGAVIGERNYGEKGEARGGGGGLRAFEQMDVRGDFRTCAYFNPAVEVDKNGKAHVSFVLPDNLTTFRAMAVVHNAEGQFGAGEEDLTVRKDLMARPVLPRFLRTEDTLRAGVLVENYSPKAGKVKVAFEGRGVELLDKDTQTATVAADTSGLFEFSVVPRVKADSAWFTFGATLGRYRDAVRTALPIVFERPMETVALMGNTTDTHQEKLVVPADTYEHFGSVHLGMSSTALIGLGGSVEYLFDYPYGCLEQRVSRVLPLLLFEEMVKAFGIETLEYENAADVVQDYLDKLPSFQTDGGGYSYWAGGTIPSPYVTAYACLSIVKARKKGYAFDRRAAERAFDYLRGVLKREDRRRSYPYNRSTWHAISAFIVYVLATHGDYERAYVERLYKRQNELPLFAKTHLLKAVHHGGGKPKQIAEALRRDIENSAKIEAATAHFEEPEPDKLRWIHHSTVRATAMVLQALIESYGEYHQADKVVRWLMREQELGRWRSTQENLYVFWALADYFGAYEKEEPDFAAKIAIDGTTYLKGLFKGRSAEQKRTEIPLTKLPKARELPLTMTKDGQGRLYYEVRMRYAPEGTLQPREEGLRITSEYTDVAGKSVDPAQLRLGEVVAVTLTVSTPRDRLFVAVDEPLPAGCEIVDPRLSTVSTELRDRLTDIRSRTRRDRWWGSWTHSEFRDQRCLVFADYLTAGSHSFTFLMRPTSPGTFYTPPAHAEEMYTPEVFGRGAEREVVVR